MNEMILDAIYIMIGLVLAIVTFIGSLNFLMKGMPWAYIKTRMSNDKKTLIRVNSALDKYWTTGQVKDRSLYLKLRGNKTEIAISNITEEHYYRSMGVNCIDIDERGLFAYTKNQQIPKNLPDPIIFDSLLKRAMMAPSENQKQFIILLILIILTLCVAGFAAYKANQAVTLIQALKMLSGNV
jgi:uncharacterized protein (UPF0333 family)